MLDRDKPVAKRVAGSRTPIKTRSHTCLCRSVGGGIRATSSVEPVSARAAIQRIVASVAIQNVRAAAAVNHIIAAERIEHVIKG